MFAVTDAWRTTYPEAHAGFLVMQDVANPAADPTLVDRKQALQDRLRAQYAGQDRAALGANPTLLAYNTYYKQFKKTYHVLAQLESIAFKGRAIPSAGALVEAMFMAEVKNLLLTAGHDLDRVQLPVTLGVAGGSESYTTLRGQEQVLKAGDMCMADQAGVISSIVYGPDQRTPITAETRNALFAVYAPAGIPAVAVQMHLQDIAETVRTVSPAAVVKRLEVLGG